MKKIFRKNQIIITTLAFLIAIAGYVSYDHLNGKKDSAVKEANADVAQEDYIVDNNTYDIFEDTDGTETMEEITGEVKSDTDENSTETSAVAQEADAVAAGENT